MHLKSPGPHQWNSVAERKPEDKAEILAWDGNEVMAVYYQEPRPDENGKHRKEKWAYHDFLVTGITHWMPMPDPPATEGDT